MERKERIERERTLVREGNRKLLGMAKVKCVFVF